MIVSFISLKGGVGKTTLANNLAAYLKKEYNYKVLIINTNGIYSSNLIFLNNEKFFGNKIYEGIKILPYFHLKIIDNLDFSINDLNYLKRYYDVIIFDVLPNINYILNIEKISDINFLVINPDFYPLYVNKKLYDLLDKNKVKIVENKYDKSIEIDFIEDVFNKEVYTVIPIVKDFINYQLQYQPIAFYNEKSIALKYIDELAYCLTGNKKKRSILDIIFR
ncbi:AAA family ATPase [Candidatus Nanopusillus massiliensis]|uniref:AAA family ATPase n=1 Tax=Candidatus Nanopusillus massiliensis TaxID=2897163 RepID=UPI001E2CD3F4|nr:AAA family ATPase [Candidatus Nanopusillus massiliensis]